MSNRETLTVAGRRWNALGKFATLPCSPAAYQLQPPHSLSADTLVTPEWKWSEEEQRGRETDRERERTEIKQPQSGVCTRLTSVHDSDTCSIP